MRFFAIAVLLICLCADSDAALGADGASSAPSTAPAAPVPEDIQIDRAELLQRMMHAHQHAPENGTFSRTAVFETVEAKVSPPTQADLKLYQMSIKARVERDVRAGTFFEPEKAAALKRAGHDPSNPDDGVVQQEIAEAAKVSVEAYVKMMSSRGGTHKVESRFDAIVDRKNRALLWRSWLLAAVRSTTETASKRNPAPDETPDQIYSITRPLLTV